MRRSQSGKQITAVNVFGTCQPQRRTPTIQGSRALPNPLWVGGKTEFHFRAMIWINFHLPTPLLGWVFRTCLPEPASHWVGSRNLTRADLPAGPALRAPGGSSRPALDSPGVTGPLSTWGTPETLSLLARRTALEGWPHRLLCRNPLFGSWARMA
jgi:hypothetical protein